MRATLCLAPALALFLISCAEPATEAQAEGAAADKTSANPGWPTTLVSATGDISLPDDFDTWPTLGSWSTADGTGVQNGMHQVYASPGAIEGFRSTGTFPDGSVLVKEVRGAATADLSTGAASYATEKQVWFVMVKDASGRFEDNPLWGDGWGWALFEAKDPSKQAAKDYQADSKGSHIPAEGRDWISAEAYPVLWPDKVAPKPSWQSDP